MKFWKAILNLTALPRPTFYALPYFRGDRSFGPGEVFEEKRASEKGQKRWLWSKFWKGGLNRDGRPWRDVTRPPGGKTQEQQPGTGRSEHKSRHTGTHSKTFQIKVRNKQIQLPCQNTLHNTFWTTITNVKIAVKRYWQTKLFWNISSTCYGGLNFSNNNMTLTGLWVGPSPTISV